MIGSKAGPLTEATGTVADTLVLEGGVFEETEDAEETEGLRPEAEVEVETVR